MPKHIYFPIKFVVTLLVILWILFLSILVLQDRGYIGSLDFWHQISENDEQAEDQPTMSFDPVSVNFIKVGVNESAEQKIADGYDLMPDFDLPDFITLEDRGEEGLWLVANPSKVDRHESYVKVTNGVDEIVYAFSTEFPKVDWGAMNSELRAFLGSKVDDYGIYIYDLATGDSLGINENREFAPASMAKLTVAILVLRDIENGRYTLDDTFPLQGNLKFGNIDDLSTLPNGTEVTIRTYLDEMIKASSNTAWYHLVDFLGKSYEVVNPRTIEELGVNPLFMDPHKGTAKNIGKILIDVYDQKTLTEESGNYLIDTMKSAYQWNREGIGQGLPADVDFANKIGRLWTEKDIAFEDAAIVFGKNRDYVLVIMNQDVDWVTGKNNLKKLSEIVYKYIDVRAL